MESRFPLPMPIDGLLMLGNERRRSESPSLRPDEPFEPYVTCATDASKFHVVIDNLKKGILVENLRKHGVDV